LSGETGQTLTLHSFGNGTNKQGGYITTI